ncbi:MAG: hypothetical protein NVS3B3_04540 [Aquirhabdus sp.]
MSIPFTKDRIKTYRTISKRLGVQVVARLFAEFQVPVELAVKILAKKG